jgi:hypothetical protein
MYLCGEDFSGSISNLSRFIITPLANAKITIMAISMYQYDLILIQEKDYDAVVKCLSQYIPDIYDENLTAEKEHIFSWKNKSKLQQQQASSRTGDEQNKKYSNQLSEEEVQKISTIELPLKICEKKDYCITGLYSRESFSLIIPTLIEIMFFGTE